MNDVQSKLTIFLTVLLITGTTYLANAQPPWAQYPYLCGPFQQCIDENFVVNESDDLRAGEFFNTVGTNNTHVIHAEYTGGVPASFDWAYKAIYGESNPADWFGVASRFEAGFCAIEAFALSDGTDHTFDFGPGEITNADFYGVRSGALGGGANSLNYGTYTDASGSHETATNYGIYATAYGDGTSYAGYFDGDVTVMGTFNNPSDARLKTNTQKLDNSLGLINQLEAKSYQYKISEFDYMRLPEGTQFGFVAQEVEKVFPELVKDNIHPASSFRRGDERQHDKLTYKGVNYIGLIPVMVNAINEQTAIIEEKDQRIAELENQLTQVFDRLENIESALNLPASKNQTSKVPVLHQNQPNPTNGISTINYFLPETTQQAFLKIYNASGKEVKSYTLQNNGNQNLDVNLKHLANGSYFYTLFVDGKAIATKQMVVH